MQSEPSSGIKLTAYSCICWLFHRILATVWLLTNIRLKSSVLWGVTPCSLVDRYKRSGGTYRKTCTCKISWQQNFPKRQYVHMLSVTGNTNPVILIEVLNWGFSIVPENFCDNKLDHCRFRNPCKFFCKTSILKNANICPFHAFEDVRAVNGTQTD